MSFDSRPSYDEVAKAELAIEIPVHSARRSLCAKQAEKIDSQRELAHDLDYIRRWNIGEKHDPGAPAGKSLMARRSRVLGAEIQQLDSPVYTRPLCVFNFPDVKLNNEITY